MANNGGGIHIPTAPRSTATTTTTTPPPQPRYGGGVTPTAIHFPPNTPPTIAPPPRPSPRAPPIQQQQAGGLLVTGGSQGRVPPPVPPFTLAIPRPENERTTNEYVETPFRPPTQASTPIIAPTPTPLPRPTRLAVTKQPPPASSFSKDPPPAASGAECTTRPSIVCPDCGRCRCESCQQPKPLPQKWVCNNSYLISADSVIDYASCLCCVKGLFYHCSEADGEQADCADAPCGCNPEKRAARWSCLAALSCVLPCLWLYWPLRGCKRVVEACYARHSRTGCRCRPPLPTPEKRLLDSSGDF